MTSAEHGRVLVAGSINMDIVARVDRHPRPGESLRGASLAYFPGGKGANQAVAAARAGATVVMLGAVGSDSFGPELLDFLRSNGIDVTHVAHRAGVPSGTALVLVDASGENEIVVVPGANESVDEAIVRGIEITASDIVVAQFETPLPTTRAFFSRARRVGARRVLNPAPPAPIPDDLLPLIDVLIVNETELGAASGTTIPAEPGASEVHLAFEMLRSRGLDGVLVTTLGARGSITMTSDRVIEVPARPVTAVDTTAAGDCFVGYVASGLAAGAAIDEVLGMANIAASLCVQTAGAGPSLPAREHVLDAAREHDRTLQAADRARRSEPGRRREVSRPSDPTP
jgi:ribokinase